MVDRPAHWEGGTETWTEYRYELNGMADDRVFTSSKAAADAAGRTLKGSLPTRRLKIYRRMVTEVLVYPDTERVSTEETYEERVKREANERASFQG